MLLKTLLNSGILPQDAQILEAHFANADTEQFLIGLEDIARMLGLKTATMPLPPTTEPWSTIHSHMTQNGDRDAAFLSAIGSYDAPLQVAISGAINTRVRELIDYQQQVALSGGKKKKTAEYTRILRNLGYTFKYNVMRQEVEVNGEPMTDAKASEIRTKLRDAGIFEVNIVEDVWLVEAWKNRYHPIKNYLTSLKFEGGDPISELATYFVDEHGVFSIWLRRWLIGACARIMAGEQNRVLVLDGAQRIGKDHFAKWLCSPNPEYFYEGPILPDDKDCRLRRLWTWVWDVNEFGSTTRRADREALKSFITTQYVTERKPYARFDVRGQAAASFIGTVNNEVGILSDPTGNRRFMISHIKHIDWSYTRMDVDQVWAQAFDLYITGEPWELQPDEWRTAEEINEQYRVIDPVEETILKFYSVDPSNTTLWTPTMDILDTLKDPSTGNLRAGVEVDARRISAALTKLGLQQPSHEK